MRLLRNLLRRKLRTTLTIVGITIGIWALVVMSSMANKISALVDGGSAYYRDKIIVTDATNPAFGFGFTPLTFDVVERIAALDGVAVAVPEVQLLLDPDASGAEFGLPDMVVGNVAGADQGRESFELSAAQGRLLTADDEGHQRVVLGSDIARKFSKRPGQTLDIRGTTFEVVGVLEPTLTAPDTTALIPLEAAQSLLAKNLPLVIRENVANERLATQVIVYPELTMSPAELAERIKGTIGQVQTLTGEKFDEEVGSATAIFRAIIVGVGGISLIVGGLSVINTMAMSVAERTREIGIKRAIGATRGKIMRELVVEAGAIGFIGGIIGLVLGAVVVFVANEAGRASGTILFQLTSGTGIFAVVFATILGMLAGLIPAWNAARLDPVEALRYE